MNRVVSWIVALVMVLFSSAVFAQAPQTEAQVRSDLLQKLEADGFLSAKMANEARQKYVDVKQMQAPVAPAGKAASARAAEPESTFWQKFATWLNFVKLLAVILLLFAFGGTIRNIIRGTWHLLVKVPVEVYQVPMLAVSLYATLMPQVFWTSQALYVALLASFANLILVGWVLITHPRLAAALKKLFDLGIPLNSVISFGTMLYFGALALHYGSPIFGFFTAVSFSSVLSFGLYYSTGTLFLYFANKGLTAVVFGHLAAIGLYVFLTMTGSYPASANVFNTGIEYYCTIALCVGLLVGSSPWTYLEKTRPFMVLLFIAVFVASTMGYIFWDLKVIGSIVSCFFILFLLEWIAKFGFSAGVVAGSAVLGISLYGIVMLAEKFGSLIVLSAT